MLELALVGAHQLLREVGPELAAAGAGLGLAPTGPSSAGGASAGSRSEVPPELTVEPVQLGVLPWL